MDNSITIRDINEAINYAIKMVGVSKSKEDAEYYARATLWLGEMRELRQKLSIHK